MRRGSLLVIVLLLCNCVFAEKWQLEERDYSSYKYYKILEAPEKYECLIGSYVYSYKTDTTVKNLFAVPCENRILNYLKKEDFEIVVYDNLSFPVLPSDFLNCNFTMSKEELDYLWDLLSTKYAGFSDMEKRGFTEKKFLKIRDSDELIKVLKEYVDDKNFQLSIKDRSYSQQDVLNKYNGELFVNNKFQITAFFTTGKREDNSSRNYLVKKESNESDTGTASNSFVPSL